MAKNMGKWTTKDVVFSFAALIIFIIFNTWIKNPSYNIIEYASLGIFLVYFIRYISIEVVKGYHKK